jgi:flagellin-like hook-associated protein FlgL
MRISSQQIFDVGISAIQKHTGDVVEYQRQISSGQRYSKASESPLAAGLGVQVSLKRAVFAMHKVNQDHVNASLTSTDTQLSSLQNMLARFQQMTVQAGNDAIGPEGRQQLAFQARVLIDSFAKFAGAKDANGQFILKEEGGVSKVLVAPTIELESALTLKEVIGRSDIDTAASSDVPPVNVDLNGLVDILTVLNKIEARLSASQAPLADDVDDLQLALGQISKAQAKTGVLQNELDAAVQSAETQKENTEANRVSLLDTDLAEATAGLARANALLQAVQTVISGMNTNSLFSKL